MRDYKKDVLEQIEDAMASAITTNQKEEIHNILNMLAKSVKADKFNQHELRMISVFAPVAMFKNSELSECEDLDKFSEMFRKIIYEVFEEDSSVEFLINTILDLTHDIMSKYNAEVMADIALITNNTFDNNSYTAILQSSQAILNSKESIIKSILKTYMATTNNQDTKPNRTFESRVSKSKISWDSDSGKLLN